MANSKPAPDDREVDADLAPDAGAPRGPRAVGHGLPQRAADAASTLLGQHVHLGPAEVEVLCERELELGHADQPVAVVCLPPDTLGVRPRLRRGDLEGVERLEERVRTVGPGGPVLHVVPAAAGVGVGHVELADVHRTIRPHRRDRDNRISVSAPPARRLVGQ